MHPSSRLGGNDGRFAYMAVIALAFASETTGRTRRMAIWTGVDVSECFGLLGEEFKAARITCMEDAIDGKALARVHPSELGLTCADWPACVAACLDETHAFRSEDSAVSTKTKCSWNVTGPIQVLTCAVGADWPACVAACLDETVIVSHGPAMAFGSDVPWMNEWRYASAHRSENAWFTDHVASELDSHGGFDQSEHQGDGSVACNASAGKFFIYLNST